MDELEVLRAIYLLGSGIFMPLPVMSHILA